MSTVSNVKVLTWLQVCTIGGVILLAWLYFGPRQTAAARRGSVNGILFTPEDPSVLVDGHVLKVGDTIYGVEVIEIGKRTVAFEKNGQKWEQRVRERPNPAWEESDSRLEADTNNL